jgi:hypothetical protein
MPSGSRFIAPPTVQKAALQGDAYMDGQKVGHIVWAHQADAMERTTWGVSAAPDPRMALIPVGLDAA